MGRKYAFPENENKLKSIALEIDSRNGPVTLVARVDGADQRIVFGRGKWLTGKAAWISTAKQPLAASGGWTANDTFTGKVCLYETPYVVTVSLKHAGSELRCTSTWNVRFGGAKRVELLGKAQGH